MNENTIPTLYSNEREYQRCSFGEYKNIKALNFASFLNFLQTYLQKAQNAYTGKWERQLPPWLLSCKEFEQEGSAPVEAYEQLIKVMTLAGAALETFAKIDPQQWRINPEEESRKWRE